MSASLAWVSWKAASGLSKIDRVPAYGDGRLEAVAGRAHRAEHDPEPGLVQARQRPGQPLASRAAARRRAAGRPSSTSSEVTEARSDSLRLISGAENPGVSVGTTKPRTRPSLVGCPDHRDVGDRPVGDPHLGAVEHPVVRRRGGPGCASPAGSDPASGSVSPKQPIASPAAIRGSHSCFCSSDPCLQIANIASDPCTLTPGAQPGVAGLQLQAGQPVRRRAWCPRSRSPRGACPARRAPRAPWPGPAPGSSPPRTSPPPPGRIRSSTNRRTVSRIARSSSPIDAVDGEQLEGGLRLVRGPGQGAPRLRVVRSVGRRYGTVPGQPARSFSARSEPGCSGTGPVSPAISARQLLGGGVHLHQLVLLLQHERGERAGQVVGHVVAHHQQVRHRRWSGCPRRCRRCRPGWWPPRRPG